MQPARTYEYLVLARERMLAWAKPLSHEQHVQQFPIGLGSLARTLTHIMVSEWYYVERMMERSVPPYAKWPIKDESPPPLAEVETEWAVQAARTAEAIGAIKDWARELEYEGEDDGKRIVVRATPMDIFTQLVLHEVHHRAQAMNMLRHLGVKAEDIDFNTLMYRRRPV